MEWKDDVCPVADAKLALNVDARFLQSVHLIEQSHGVHHHAVADDGLDTGAQNPARDELQNVLRLADENRVPGVMPTLVTRNDVEFVGEEIDNLALALVAPLRAQHDDVGHLGTKATIVS